MADPPGRTSRWHRLRQVPVSLPGLLRLPKVVDARLDVLELAVGRIEAGVDGVEGLQRAHTERLDDHRDRLVRLEHSEEVLHRRIGGVGDPVRAAQHAAAELALQLAGVDPPPPGDTLVSVLLPTWQRAAVVGEAIASVLAQTHEHWELLVTDDGSTDGTDEVVAAFDDPRIRYERTENRGECAARNHALRRATGDIVATLDSDNTWHPTHLARAVAALERAPHRAWAISGQVLVDSATGELRLRPDHRGIDTLIDSNFIDTNVMAVRREALLEVGGWDESLTRLGDWDLALRLRRFGPPARTGAATSIYRTDLADRVLGVGTRPGDGIHVAAHRVRARHRGQPAAGLRVLLAEWHFPHLTETYINAAVRALVGLGAHVEAWTQEDVVVSGEVMVPIHRGPDLAETIEAVDPDLVLTHWLTKGIEYHPVVAAAGKPHVVRVHGFDYQPDRVVELLAAGALVHTFPHLVEEAWADHPRLVVAPAVFDEERYPPAPPGHKDPRMVLRTAAGLFTKDLETFLLAANLCPDHRFVLVLGRSKGCEGHTDVLVARAEELGSRAEILVDVDHARMAELMAEAGIYLHTHGTDHAVSMPISIAEALATGCYVLARDLPGLAAYVGPSGDLYGGATVEERARAAADLVQATQHWSPARWASVAAAASDHAYAHYASTDVHLRLVRAWRQAFRLPAAR